MRKRRISICLNLRVVGRCYVLAGITRWEFEWSPIRSSKREMLALLWEPPGSIATETVRRCTIFPMLPVLENRASEGHHTTEHLPESWQVLSFFHRDKLLLL